MKKNIFILLFALCSLPGIAQKNAAHERITSAKIGLITSRLNLNTDQAPMFWATYNEYTDKKMLIRKDLRKLKMQDTSAEATDSDVKEALNQMLTLRQNEVDLEKEYMSKFLKAITPKQLAELYKTEQDFTKLLLERLEEKRSTVRDKRPTEKEQKMLDK